MLVTHGQYVDVPNLATLSASRSDRRAAAVVAFGLIVIALIPFDLGRAATPPVLPATVLIHRSLMSAAYLITSYLLLSQFRSTGLLALAATGAGYAFIGLLQIPYVLTFPNIWVTGQLLGNAASPSWLGLAWHVIFAVVIGAYVLYDRSFNAAVEKEQRGRIIRAATACAVALATAITLIALNGNLLPAVYSAGSYVPLFSSATRSCALIDFLICIWCAVRTRGRTLLQLWLIVGLLGMDLDQVLYASAPFRFGWAWYGAQIVTLATAAIVLIILLREMTALYLRVTEMATVDQLTGLPNRRTLEGQLDWLHSYGRRHGMSLAVAMIDVDCFKNYNDSYGHVAGDVVLRRIAQTLQASVLRSSDLVARYGGEEFVVLLPDATREGTALAVERMRTSIERLAIVHSGTAQGRVTISIGAAVGTLSGDVAPRDLLRAADETLYAAKAEGRNRCVVVACGSGSPPRRMSLIDAG